MRFLLGLEYWLVRLEQLELVQRRLVRRMLLERRHLLVLLEPPRSQSCQTQACGRVDDSHQQLELGCWRYLYFQLHLQRRCQPQP